MTQFNVPIVFLVFNRPETTARVFDEIRRMRPLKLLMVADGPRSGRAGELEKCNRVRSIIDHVDWPCEVRKNYSDINLGCKLRVSSGLDWVFEQVEEAIILEDDCLPHPSFFLFCRELLEKYREDERVAMISGDNFQFGLHSLPSSYYFSRYPHIWGWATWRRAWRLYDLKMSTWPEIQRRGLLHDLLRREPVVRFWEKIFTKVFAGEIDTWDHQLTFAFISNNRLCIMPDRNLVSNIGFGEDATHTRRTSMFAEVPLQAMKFPLHHPSCIIRDNGADERTENEQYTYQRIMSRIMNMLGRIFHAV